MFFLTMQIVVQRMRPWLKLKGFNDGWKIRVCTSLLECRVVTNCVFQIRDFLPLMFHPNLIILNEVKQNTTKPNRLDWPELGSLWFTLLVSRSWNTRGGKFKLWNAQCSSVSVSGRREQRLTLCSCSGGGGRWRQRQFVLIQRGRQCLP